MPADSTWFLLPVFLNVSIFQLFPLCSYPSRYFLYFLAILVALESLSLVVLQLGLHEKRNLNMWNLNSLFCSLSRTLIWWVVCLFSIACYCLVRDSLNVQILMVCVMFPLTSARLQSEEGSSPLSLLISSSPSLHAFPCFLSVQLKSVYSFILRLVFGDRFYHIVAWLFPTVDYWGGMMA